MEDYFDGFPEEVTKWEIIREMIDLDLDHEFRNDPHKSNTSIKLLPRQDVILYGTIPKMEQRVYTKCKECRLVFNPRDILSHKTCSGKSYLLSTQQILKKKIKSKGSSNKKSHSTLPPPPLFKKPPSPPAIVSAVPQIESKLSTSKISSKIPKMSTVTTTTSTHTTMTTTISRTETRMTSSSSHNSKSSTVHSPKSPSKSISSSAHLPKSSSKSVTGTETTASSTTSSTSSTSSNSNRYKKSRKNNSSTKITKEFDPDVHCGVIEGSRGPCTRSITCSNHRIQLRKLVPGRSKDIHQLIAERKAAKEKDLKHGATSGSYPSPNGTEEKDVFCQNTSYVLIVATIVSTIDSSPTTTYVPIMPKTSNISTHSRQTTTSVLTAKQLNTTDLENNSAKTVEGGFLTNVHSNSSQKNAIGTVPVVYKPMSPISVVSPDPYMQLGKMYMESPQSAVSPPLTTNQSIFLTIPNQQNTEKLYKSHPKPVAVPTYGTKKVGRATLLSNPHLQYQRNDILMAINTKREIVNNSQGYRAISLLNHSNTPHRPNILKVKSVNKVNCKRPAVDKTSSSDSKQLRLGPYVNGFILHSDISESADAPQPNNCIQEKIALLNMK